MKLRPSRDQDIDQIEAIHQLAFGGTPEGLPVLEVQLVRALRADVGWVPDLSIVAAEDTDVLGHVVSTEGSLGEVTVLGLGPIGVHPDLQGRGIGAALMERSIAEADARGYPAIVLLGHTDYYPRFGFVPAATLGIDAPDPSWGEHFQARPLSAWTPALGGLFRYAAPFNDL